MQLYSWLQEDIDKFLSIKRTFYPPNSPKHILYQEEEKYLIFYAKIKDDFEFALVVPKEDMTSALKYSLLENAWRVKLIDNFTVLKSIEKEIKGLRNGSNTKELIDND